jgi:hypothetical protein
METRWAEEHTVKARSERIGARAVEKAPSESLKEIEVIEVYVGKEPVQRAEVFRPERSLVRTLDVLGNEPGQALAAGAGRLNPDTAP